MTTTDFIVHDEGTIFLLRPITDRAEAWVDDNLPDDALTFGGAVVVEHRFIADIVAGIIGDGLKVK